MFEVIGFAIALIVMCGFTVMMIFIGVYCMGQYNIGGVPHTWKDRVWIIPALILLYLGWSVLIDNSPISIVIS
jgi:hypothetical protein